MLLVFVLTLPKVQTSLGTYATKTLQEVYDVHISVNKINLSYLGRIKLDNVLIKDHHNNKMIAAKKIETSLVRLVGLLNNTLNLGKASLYEGEFYLRTYKGESKSNLTVFSKKFQNTKKKKKKLFVLKSERIVLFDIDFEILNENREGKPLIVSYEKIGGTIEDFHLLGTEVHANIRGAHFIDNNGLKVNNLTTNFVYTSTQMQFVKTKLVTDKSLINAEVLFNYKIGELSDFINKVQINAVLRKSDVSMIDLKKFYNEFGGNDVLHFNTSFEGTLNNFQIYDLELFSDHKLTVSGDYMLKNIFGKKEDFQLEAQTKKLVSNYEQLKGFLPNVLGGILPSEIKKMGTFEIVGDAKVTTDEIDVDTTIESEIGNVTANLQMYDISDIDKASYKGTVDVVNFNLAEVIGDPNLGEISLEGYIDGKGVTVENIAATLDGKITKHQYKGYTYKNIIVNGDFKNRLFNGNLKVDDQNLKLDFSGLADLSSAINKFDFTAKVAHADFSKLNLFTRDSISVLKGDIKIDLEGNTIDQLRGKANFLNASYTGYAGTYEFKDFNIVSSEINNIKNVSINSSDIASGSIYGNFKFSQIFRLIQNSMGSMMVNYKPLEVEENQYFDFDFEIFSEVIEVILPTVRLAPNTVLRGKLNDDRKELKLFLKTPKLAIKNNVLDSLYLELDNKNPRINTNLKVKKIKLSNYSLHDVNLLNKTLNDTLFFRADFTGGKVKEERFDVSFYYTFDTDNNSVLGIQKSKIHFKENDWFINPQDNKKNKLVFNINKEEYNIEEFEIESKEQEIYLRGNVIDSTYKDIRVTFNKVDLDGITPKIDSLSLGGRVNGDINFKQDKGKYQPFGKLNIDDFTINKAEQGDLKMLLQAENSYKKYNIDLSLEGKESKSLNATGLVDLSPRIPQINLDVQLDQFQLSAFSPLGKDVLSKIRGIATGEFNVSGNLSNPDMKGQLKLTNTGMLFPYLNVDYNLVEDPVVKLEKQSFLFENVLLEDSKYGTEGVLTGEISHKGFKDWYLDLNVGANRLVALDTEDKEGVSYYGTGFIKGVAKIKGGTNDLLIDIKAKTLEGTTFIIPLSDVKSVENSDLIHFKRSIEETKEIGFLFDKERLLENLQGLTLKFDIDVTRDANAEIVIDKISGSSIKGNGDGKLFIEIDTKGEFKMYGDYSINKGTYNFSYGGVIEKPFEIQKGGTIAWDGDPYNADLNIVAIHRVKANPKVLLESLNTNRKIDIDLVTTISGSLFDSTEEFDIVIPNSSSLVASELSFKLNNDDENAKIRQFFSLLVTKSFYSEDNLTNSGNTAITGTTTDIISGTLSDIFNQEGDKFQIDLGYTSGEKNDVETLNIDDQVDISMATQLTDRVTINGKLGVPVGTTSESTITGEVKIEIQADKEGNLRWTVFNRQNEIEYSQEEEGYTQGVGLSYRINFDTFKEVLRKLGFFKKEDKEILDKDDDLQDELILVAPTII